MYDKRIVKCKKCDFISNRTFLTCPMCGNTIIFDPGKKEKDDGSESEENRDTR